MPKRSSTRPRNTDAVAPPVTAAPSGKNWRGQTIVRCFSQADLDAALTRDVEIWLCGPGRYVVVGDTYLSKIKARGNCGPCVEVDIFSQPVTTAVSAA